MKCDTTQFLEFSNKFYEKKDSGPDVIRNNILYEFSLKLRNTTKDISYKGSGERSIFDTNDFYDKFDDLCNELAKKHGWYLFSYLFPVVFDYLYESISVGENSESNSKSKNDKSTQEKFLEEIREKNLTRLVVHHSRTVSPNEKFYFVEFRSGDFKKFNPEDHQDHQDSVCNLNWACKNHPSDIVAVYVDRNK